MVSSNLNFKKEGDVYKMFYNPEFYPMDVIFSTSYVFLEKAYIYLSGDSKKEIVVNIKPKEGIDGEKLIIDFNDELLNYIEYKNNLISNKGLRDMILQRAIVTNDSSVIDSKDEIGDFSGDLNDNLDELEEVVIPWEENEENN